MALQKITPLSEYWLEKLEIKAVFDLVLRFYGILDVASYQTESSPEQQVLQMISSYPKNNGLWR